MWEDLAHGYELGKHWHGTSNMSNADFRAVLVEAKAEKRHFFPVLPYVLKMLPLALLSAKCRFRSMYSMAHQSFQNVLNANVKETFPLCTICLVSCL